MITNDLTASNTTMGALPNGRTALSRDHDHCCYFEAYEKREVFGLSSCLSKSGEEILMR